MGIFLQLYVTGHPKSQPERPGSEKPQSSVIPTDIPVTHSDPHHMPGHTLLPQHQSTTQNPPKHKKGHNSLNMAQIKLKIAEMESTVLANTKN